MTYDKSLFGLCIKYVYRADSFININIYPVHWHYPGYVLFEHLCVLCMFPQAINYYVLMQN